VLLLTYAVKCRIKHFGKNLKTQHSFEKREKERKNERKKGDIN